MHVFAVSGMHVGLAAMLILGLLRLLLIRPPVARLACIPLLALYVFVTGMSVSALRALIMAVVWLLASVCAGRGIPPTFWLWRLSCFASWTRFRFSSRGSSFLSACLP